MFVYDFVVRHVVINSILDAVVETIELSGSCAFHECHVSRRGGLAAIN